MSLCATRRFHPHNGLRGRLRRSVRIASVPIVAILLIAVVAACDQSTGSGSGNGKVTLTYSIWDKNQLPAMNQIVAAFEKTHPDISVTVAITPNATYWTKLQTAATSGSAPDIFWMNLANLKLYAGGKQLLPLSDRIKAAQISLAQYNAPISDGYHYQGQQWCLPKDIDSIGLWYNKELFHEAGVKPPSDEWTWSDLISAARKITQRDKGVYGIAANDSDQQNYYNTVLQAGGYIISPDGRKSGYDSPAGIRGAEFWTDLIHKYHASPTLEQMTDTDPDQMFESGKVAMLYEGSWQAIEFSQIPYLVKNADVTVMPKGKIRATVSNGLGNCIYAKTQHPDQAWEFVKFLGSRQAASIQAKTGTVIPATKSEQQEWVDHYPQFHVRSFVDELEYSKGYPASGNTAAWRNYNQQEWALAWAGAKTVPDVAANVGSHMDKTLAAER